ncbi:MAG: sigma 54-interacting transcriptional regulator [Eubacterium sp.]
MNDFKHNEKFLDYLHILDPIYFKRTLEHLDLPILVVTLEDVILYQNTQAQIFLAQCLPEELTNFIKKNMHTAFEKRKPVICRENTLMGEDYSTAIISPVYLQLEDQKPSFFVIVVQKNIRIFDKNVQEKKERLNDKQRKRRHIIGQSHSFLQPIVELERVSHSDMAILLLGESGTGKTLIAEYIHNCSARKNNPFMSINCGAIPGELLESELFGYVNGAFTGAKTSGKRGLFELADGGTIFLDEIGDMPLDLQVKLLHVLENNTFVPVGGSESIHVDIRIISATNKNLHEQIDENKFRNDLYWRINSFTAIIPPLRERLEDIIPLALYYLKKCNTKYHTNKVFFPQTLQTLTKYHWPGNVRELKNVIERIYILTESTIIYDDDIPFQSEKEFEYSDNEIFSFDEIMDQLKNYIITLSYQKYKTSASVAEHLDVSQPTAYRLIKDYGQLN